jgi:hypothetical protein
MESHSKLEQIEDKKQRWLLAIDKLEEVLNLELDKKSQNNLLITIKPKFVIRANISIIKILLKANLKGIYICINHPSELINKLLKTHNVTTQNLIFLDFFTSITGVPMECSENVFVIDKAFSLERILEAVKSDYDIKCNNQVTTKTEFNMQNFDFIMVDNISSLATYTTQDRISNFIQDLINIIKKRSAVYGIVIIENETEPNIHETIAPFFDKTVSIKEEWV